MISDPKNNTKLAACWLVRLFFSKRFGTSSQIEHTINLIAAEEGWWFGFRRDKEPVKNYGLFENWLDWYINNNFKNIQDCISDSYQMHELLLLLEMIPEDLQFEIADELQKLRCGNPTYQFPFLFQSLQPRELSSLSPT